MGLFDFFRRKKEPRPKTTYFIKEYYGQDISTLVRSYASSIYSIPEVRIAIETVADTFASIPIYHKQVFNNGEAKYFEDDITYVLSLRANPLQNSCQFWKTVITQLLLNSNVFIETHFDRRTGQLKEIWPLPFQYFTFRLYETGATVSFLDNPKGNILEQRNLDDLIYLNRFSKLNKGDSVNLGLYETVIQALSNQILKITDPKKVRALLQGKQGAIGNLKPEHKKGTMEKFKANLDENVDGVAYIDPQWEIHDVNWQENDVNRDLMSFVINVVYNYFKITESIINNKASEIEREMFITNSIKPIANQLEQELTYKLFTENEIKAGHRIELDVMALSVSTIQAKTQLFATASRNGILNIDEMREYLGQPALPNGYGKKYRVSSDCVDIEISDKYQLGKVNTNLVSAENDKSEDINNLKKEEGSGSTETQ